MWWSMGSTIFAFQYFTYIFIDCLWCHSGCACNICIFFYLDIIVLFSRHLHSFIAHEISGLVGPVYSLWQIGIDLEEKQRRLKNDILSFARRYFSTFEVEFLQAIADPENQRQEFVKLWTLKVRFLNVLISLSSPDFFLFDFTFLLHINFLVASCLICLKHINIIFLLCIFSHQLLRQTIVLFETI